MGQVPGTLSRSNARRVSVSKLRDMDHLFEGCARRGCVPQSVGNRRTSDSGVATRFFRYKGMSESGEFHGFTCWTLRQFQGNPWNFFKPGNFGTLTRPPVITESEVPLVQQPTHQFWVAKALFACSVCSIPAGIGSPRRATANLPTRHYFHQVDTNSCQHKDASGAIRRFVPCPAEPRRVLAAAKRSICPRLPLPPDLIEPPWSLLPAWPWFNS